MRYYEVYYPGEPEPSITTAVRHLRDLPLGTRVIRTVTDRQGSLVEQEEIPVEEGRPRVAGLGKHRPQLFRPLPTSARKKFW
jgi:hypothetical protein